MISQRMLSREEIKALQTKADEKKAMLALASRVARYGEGPIADIGKLLHYLILNQT